MSVKAIVYTSETGFTAEYAELLSKKTGIPAMPLYEAERRLMHGAAIVYMGWLMAGKIKDFKKANKNFNVCAVCAVGLCETGSIINKVRDQNGLPPKMPVFTLQGGYAPEKLKGANKIIMNIVVKSLLKKIDKNPTKTEADYRMRKVLSVGGSFVSEDNLKAVVECLHKIAR